jgi:Tol biopolymer transport system component
VRVCWLPILLCGCGRLWFDPVPDATTTDAGPSCWQAWRSGSPELSAPRMMSELDIFSSQGDPSLSRDGRTLYFSANDASFDLYQTIRDDIGKPWQTPTLVTELQTASDDLRLSMNDAGTVAVFASDRPGSTSVDLWYTTRSDPSAMWGTPTQTLVAATNSIADDNNPELSADGLTLYVSPTSVPQGVARATRVSLTDPFGAPQPIAEVNTGPTTFDATVSPDELVIVFASNEGASFDLHFARRSDTAAPFGVSQVVPLVNSLTTLDGDPELSSSGCELYFASDRAIGRHLYMATVTP